MVIPSAKIKEDQVFNNTQGISSPLWKQTFYTNVWCLKFREGCCAILSWNL